MGFFMRFLGLLLACILAGKALGSEGLTVLCSSAIPADWARALAEPGTKVRSVMNPQTDPHAFQPTPEHVRQMLQADILIGFDPLLEPWMDQIIRSNNLSSKVLWIGKPWISDMGNTLACCPVDGISGGKHALLRKPEPVDPHVWTDPELVAAMGKAIHAELSRRGKAGEAGGAARLEAFLAMTARVDADLRNSLSRLPTARRGIITHHDNLGRIARRYGLRVEGVILRASTTEAADPSAREMVRLVELARTRGVRVVVVDKGQRAAAAETVALEAGMPPPLALRLDTLEAEGPGSTWEGMMREAGRALAEALAR